MEALPALSAQAAEEEALHARVWLPVGAAPARAAAGREQHEQRQK
jgi:hypothetical protein